MIIIAFAIVSVGTFDIGNYAQGDPGGDSMPTSGVFRLLSLNDVSTSVLKDATEDARRVPFHARRYDADTRGSKKGREQARGEETD